MACRSVVMHNAPIQRAPKASAGMQGSASAQIDAMTEL